MGNRHKYPSWQRRHEAIFQFLINHPSAKHRECSERTGYSVWHISRIINSPGFKRRYEYFLERKNKDLSDTYIRKLLK